MPFSRQSWPRSRQRSHSPRALDLSRPVVHLGRRELASLFRIDPSAPPGPAAPRSILRESSSSPVVLPQPLRYGPGSSAGQQLQRSASVPTGPVLQSAPYPREGPSAVVNNPDSYLVWTMPEEQRIELKTPTPFEDSNSTGTRRFYMLFGKNPEDVYDHLENYNACHYITLSRYKSLWREVYRVDEKVQNPSSSASASDAVFASPPPSIMTLTVPLASKLHYMYFVDENDISKAMIIRDHCAPRGFIVLPNPWRVYVDLPSNEVEAEIIRNPFGLTYTRYKCRSVRPDWEQQKTPGYETRQTIKQLAMACATYSGLPIVEIFKNLYINPQLLSELFSCPFGAFDHSVHDAVSTLSARPEFTEAMFMEILKVTPVPHKMPAAIGNKRFSLRMAKCLLRHNRPSRTRMLIWKYMIEIIPYLPSYLAKHPSIINLIRRTCMEENKWTTFEQCNRAVRPFLEEALGSKVGSDAFHTFPYPEDSLEMRRLMDDSN